MKTLFQKINPDVLIKMYDEQDKYHSLVELIINELNSTYQVTDLKYGTVIMIDTYAFGYFEAFSESKIMNLFNQQS